VTSFAGIKAKATNAAAIIYYSSRQSTSQHDQIWSGVNREQREMRSGAAEAIVHAEAQSVAGDMGTIRRTAYR
jgi:hypothetical protein